MSEHDGEASEISPHESYSVEIPRNRDSETRSQNSYTDGILISRDSEISHKSYGDERPKQRKSKSAHKSYRIEIPMVISSETSSQKSYSDEYPPTEVLKSTVKVIGLRNQEKDNLKPATRVIVLKYQCPLDIMKPAFRKVHVEKENPYTEAPELGRNLVGEMYYRFVDSLNSIGERVNMNLRIPEILKSAREVIEMKMGQKSDRKPEIKHPSIPNLQARATNLRIIRINR